VELSHRTTLNSLRRRASKFSFVRLHDRVKRVIGGSCAWVYLPVARKVCRPEQHGTGVSVTLPGSDGAARELDLDMGKMTVAATLGVPAGPAEEWLLGVRSRLRDRGRQPPSPMSAPCPDSSLAPTHRAGPIGWSVEAPIAPARWLERGVDLRQH